MKKWLIALAISLSVCACGLVYFSYSLAQSACLNLGGNWMGLTSFFTSTDTCQGAAEFSFERLSSTLSIAIFLGIVLGIASALIQLHQLLNRHQNKP